MAEALLSVLRVRGLDTLNATCTRLERSGSHLQLTLGSGALVDTDVVIGAAGLRPALELVRIGGRRKTAPLSRRAAGLVKHYGASILLPQMARRLTIHARH